MSNRVRYAPTEIADVFKSTRSYTDGTEVMWAWFNRATLTWWVSYANGDTTPSTLSSSLHSLKKEVKNFLTGAGVVFTPEVRAKKTLD